MKKIVYYLIINYIYLSLVLGVVIVIAPIHELFHVIPCELSGLNSEISYFGVTCEGIDSKPALIQFFYFIGPYIFYAFVLIGLYYLAKKKDFVKYFISIPAMDILFNYFSTLKPDGSDFFYLANSLKPNFVPFIIAIVLVCFVVGVTISAYRKFKIYDFNFLIGNIKRLFYKN